MLVPLCSCLTKSLKEVRPAMTVPVPVPTARFRLSRRLCSIAGLAFLVVGAFGGTAFARWNSHGGGSNSAATGSLAPVTVVALTGTPTTSLLPGGSSDVVLKVSNTNAYSVILTSIAITPGQSVTASNGSCTTSGVTITFPSSPSISVPAGSSQVDVPGAASMSLASQNACQGNTFTFPVTVTFAK
jgi:hypothetical protein